MSKLSERMRRAARPESRPVGLVVTASAPQATMLVVAEAGARDAAKVAESADAVLLSEDAGADAVKAAVAAGIPIGVRLPKGDRGHVAKLREAGADFFVLSEDAAASALMEEEVSYILDVPGDPTDTDLRALETLQLEAILAPPVDAALTIRRSIGLRRFVAFARKPLMLPVSADIAAPELEALRELNVMLLLAPADVAAGLRDKVAGLPPRRQRRGEGGNVGVPSFFFGNTRTVEEPGEDDHDHD
jgi:hypothetical protein